MKIRSWLGLSLMCSANCLLVLCLTEPAQAGTQWCWPISPHQMLRAFSPPPEPWLPGHRGIDLAAHPGQTVHSAGNGFVTYASTLAGRGVVVIQHGMLHTTYEPVSASVSVGDFVLAGEVIGRLTPGLSHCSQIGRTTCLHWGLRRGFSYLNPLLLVGGYVRLLPVPD